MLTIDGTMSVTFAVLPLSKELQEGMLKLGVQKTDCPVGIDRLRLVKFIHYDFAHEKQQGEMVVLEKDPLKFMQVIQEPIFWKNSPQEAYESLNIY